MGNITDILDIAVSLASSGVGAEGFGTLLIATDELPTMSNRTEEYSSAAAAITDTANTGMLTSDQVYKDLADAFSSKLRPKTIKIGRIDSASFVAQSGTITITLGGGVGVVWTIVIDGVETITYTEGAGPETTTEIATGIADAITAAAPPGVTASSATNVVTLLASTAGDGFSVTCSASATGTCTVDDDAVAANYGYQDELDLIAASDDDWYGLTITDRDMGNIEEVAAWVEAQSTPKPLFMAQCNDADIYAAGDSTDVLSRLGAQSYTSTALLYYPTDTKGAAAQWVANRLTVDPDKETTIWSFVTMPSITVAKNIPTLTQQSAIETKNGNYYTLWGAGITKPGVTVDGTKIHRKITRDWLETRLIEAHQNQLIDYSNLGKKIPMDNSGIAIIEAAARDVFRKGEQAGHFSSYELDMPDISDISASDQQNGIITYSFVANELGGVEQLVVTGIVGVFTDDA